MRSDSKLIREVRRFTIRFTFSYTCYTRIRRVVLTYCSYESDGLRCGRGFHDPAERLELVHLHIWKLRRLYGMQGGNTNKENEG